MLSVSNSLEIGRGYESAEYSESMNQTSDSESEGRIGDWAWWSS